eukprot:m.38601 g.38601  ORF g.38601 m.38601 type:complete len:524 (+) comp10228_c0_seq1:95-1666(+)
MTSLLGFGEKIGVINDELLEEAIKTQAPKKVSEYGIEKSGASHRDVVELELGFKKILKIENLWTLTSLTKLQLDSNFIEVIENLDSLVNLEWLDLSFNNIEVLEGLDKLTKLKDLSVHHNKISKIENLDNLKELEVLSIGDNELESLEDAPIVYLRKFPNLKCLNLAGNPLCSDDHYESFVIAHLPHLKFLDYRRVSSDMQKAAVVEYQDKLEVILALEKHEEEELRKEREIAAEKKQDLDGCVPGLRNDEFYNAILSPSVQVLRILPGVPELLEPFKEKFIEKTTALQEFGLNQAFERSEEKKELEEALEDGVRAVGDEGASMVNKFITKKQELLAFISDHGLGALADEKLSGLMEELELLRDALLEQEVDFFSEVEQTLGSFERNYQEMLSKFIERVQTTFTDLRDMEEELINEITTIGTQYIDSVSKGEADDSLELSNEAHEVVRDKTALTSAMASAHDSHVADIDNKEDEIMALLKKEIASIMDSLHADQVTRNRARVAEVNRFFRFNHKDLSDVQSDF